MTRTIIIAAVLIGLAFGAYQVGYRTSAQQAARTHYTEMMSLATHLYLAAENGQSERVRESLGFEVLAATLQYEHRVSVPERSILSSDYSAARQIASKFETHMGTNSWTRGDRLWLIDTNK